MICKLLKYRLKLQQLYKVFECISTLQFHTWHYITQRFWHNSTHLRNIELQLQPLQHGLRCHMTCVVSQNVNTLTFKEASSVRMSLVKTQNVTFQFFCHFPMNIVSRHHCSRKHWGWGSHNVHIACHSVSFTHEDPHVSRWHMAVFSLQYHSLYKHEYKHFAYSENCNHNSHLIQYIIT